MNRHTRKSILVIATILCSVGFAQANAPSPLTGTITSPGVAASETPAFPYTAEITGNAVYIRSGPGQPYYDCGQLNTGDRIQVAGSQFTWSKIVPPARCYSWISTDFVKPDPENRSTGLVTGDNVRVYAGSDTEKPGFSTSLQVKLNKGDKVKLLGAEVDRYYKIAPPDGAYLWVSTSFTRPVPPEAIPVAGTGAIIAVAPADVNTTPGPNELTVSTPAVAGADANSTATPAVKTSLDKYNSLKKQLEEEQAKPFAQQDYSAIKEGLSAIAADKTADKTARYAQAVLEQIATIELAMNADKIIKQQSKDLAKTQEQIDKDHQAALAGIQDLGKYAVMGKLQKFSVFGPGYYKILDTAGNTICTISPGSVVPKDYISLIGKQVGVVGVIETDARMGTAGIRYSQIDSLE